MIKNQPLVFKHQAAKGKPENIIHKDSYCPFCDVKNLQNIIDQQEDRIWLVNKFRTLEDTFQTVLIESSNHNGGPSVYSVEQNRQVFSFAFNCWQRLINSGKYRSVIMYKNFGPQSGGSLAHPHFQIVGLDNYDVYQNIKHENLNGKICFENEDVSINISTQPIIGFLEVNVRISSISAVKFLADAVQKIIYYVLNDYNNGRCHSYNLFFYQMDDGIYCKIVPRFPTSPYFVGYKIPQVHDEKWLDRIAGDLSKLLSSIQ